MTGSDVRYCIVVSGVLIVSTIYKTGIIFSVLTYQTPVSADRTNN